MFKILYRTKFLLLAAMLITSVCACSKIPDATNASLENVYDAESDTLAKEALKSGKIALQIGDHKLYLEYADSPEERALGLMYRRSMCEDCGMLFKFDSSRVGSIWMKNTFIPLDLAYISEDGKIVDIMQLEPHNLTPVRSSLLILYALEMNQGWFAKKDIRVGDTVASLP